MELRKELEEEGREFQSSTDSEVICHLLTKDYSKTHDMVESIKRVSKKLIGSYSLVLLVNDDLMVVRDPVGIKPLAMGKGKETILIASETVAFDVVGAEYVRDVEPGEILLINDEVKSFKIPKKPGTPRAHCMFEYVYFARPDSILDGRIVYNVRKNIGKALCKEHPVDADVVMPVPDSVSPQPLAIPVLQEFLRGRINKKPLYRPNFYHAHQEERETSVS